MEDTRLRAAVYETALGIGRIPAIHDLAVQLHETEDEVRASLQRLAEAHALVLQREGGEILMANPFSAVPTAFPVLSGAWQAWGNCIWDALGILAMLRRDGRVDASCGCCGTAMALHVEGGALLEMDGIVHYAVPARQWWNDIVFN